MHTKLLTLSAAGSLALAVNIGLPPASASLHSGDPEVSESPLSGISATGALSAGARDASSTTRSVTRTKTTSLPPLLRAPQSLRDTSAHFTSAVVAHAQDQAVTSPSSTESPHVSNDRKDGDLAAPTGSGAAETTDGITISALSDVIDLPSASPNVVGIAFDDDVRVEFEIRTHTNGRWSGWQHLHASDAGEGSRGTDPYYTTDTDSIQVRVLGDGGSPADAKVVSVASKRHPGDSELVAENAPKSSESVDREVSQHAHSIDHASVPPCTRTGGCTCPLCAASAANVAKNSVVQPEVATRKDWGASEKLVRNSPTIADSVSAAVIHHTDGNNDYAAEDVPAILRGIQSFHITGRGWSDIGYNMLVDKYGRLWEGRAGGVKKAVVGAHAAGYNTGSFGISVLGDYDKKAPPQRTLDAVAEVVGWKLSLSGVKAGGSTSLAGEEMKAIVGHRDVGQTSCPGDGFYAKFDSIRQAADDYQTGKKAGAGEEDENKDESDRQPDLVPGVIDSNARDART
ncbi:MULTISPECIES: peptidoglycan recognition protein family protein [Micrococcales]|uniref:N-acetylmuramoyl-L-alanine amidase n=1 Tax=Brevibacterium aurantiacum TaxID=273384 RepID=A0A1D7W1L8_BREAU|nr:MULTISPECIES: peptidoglycan recognition protein [Micrococcales]AOP52834.1 putative secreted protein [Brevibacterium aurantiacum]AZL05147.1 hypothetical protein CXR24_05710 [Brevibacterium aurantiacum]AZL08731.1 hypothetical protein CXR26_05415 [Brevibacterium aurantiacum]AZL12340.1 hypothetical protein CXR25_05605 [Brevibacterium aurantiacum]AZT92712.1 hypothetical protein CXR23_05760 [Brevibacterium aurantiacum]